MATSWIGKQCHTCSGASVMMNLSHPAFTLFRSTWQPTYYVTVAQWEPRPRGQRYGIPTLLPASEVELCAGRCDRFYVVRRMRDIPNQSLIVAKELTEGIARIEARKWPGSRVVVTALGWWLRNGLHTHGLVFDAHLEDLAPERDA